MGFRFLINLAALLALTACSSAGPSNGPLSRTAEWFSYIAAEDIQATCRAGAPDRYRFVYNAVYTEQVRTYDLSLDGADATGLLRSAVFGGFPVSTFSLTDPLARWRGEFSWETVTAESVARIQAELADAGFHAPPPVGEFLDSGDFYWVLNACIDGRHRFNVFAAPERPVGELAFFAHLLRYDRTGVAVNPVRPRGGGAAKSGRGSQPALRPPNLDRGSSFRWESTDCWCAPLAEARARDKGLLSRDYRGTTEATATRARLANRA